MVDPPFTDGRHPRPAGPYPGGAVAARPLSLTSFIGRESDVAAVVARLHQPGARLLTLTGPGGIGKTRLASRAIETLQPEDFGQMAWVSLAPVSEPDHVATTIAQALNLPLVAGQSPGEQVQAALASRRLLLVLDNLEQVAAGVAPILAHLLGTCPHLRILATSRVPLRVSGEQVMPVPPLSPASARELFMARAQAVDPTLDVSNDTGRAIDAICERLDRLPLAIELAAARVPLLPPAALLSRLDRRLDLLTGGPRDVDHRLRNMRESIAWSHELLSPSCRVLFRRLGVFAGGFTLDGAAAMVDEGDDVLDDLAALVAASLVERTAGFNETPRYAMLETIREYAIERLAASGEESNVRERHARSMVALAESTWTLPDSPGYDRWLARLRPEIDNIRLSLSWTLQNDPASAVQLAGALIDYWFIFGHVVEGRHWVMRALDAAPPGRDIYRARALMAAGRTAIDLGELDAGEEFLASAWIMLKDVPATRENAQILTFSLVLLGDSALARGDLQRARELFTEVREMADQLSVPISATMAVMDLGRIAHLCGDLDASMDLLEEALARHQATSGPIGIAYGHMYLGELLIARDMRAAAVEHLRASFTAFLDASHFGALAEVLEDLAEAALTSQPVMAARLLGGQAALPEEDLHGVNEQVAQSLTRLLESVRTRLGEPAFTTAWEEGMRLPLEELRVLVDSLAESMAITPVTNPAPIDTHGLSPRELDVLRLVAAGHSNREIATTLFISVPTVKRHITNIFGKLDLPSRTAATAWAHTHGVL